MSTIYVDNVYEKTSGSGTEVHNFIHSGNIIASGSYNSGYGANTQLTSTSTSWQTLLINGTSQNVHGSIIKGGSNTLKFNKRSSNSHLYITLNFPTYNANGGSGHGVRLRATPDDGSNYYIQDPTNLSEGPADRWGFHGYGGAHSAMNNFTWCTADGQYASSFLAKTSYIEFYFEVANWSTSDTIYFLGYAGYNKYATVQAYEVEA